MPTIFTNNWVMVATTKLTKSPVATAGGRGGENETESATYPRTLSLSPPIKEC